jgi:BolA family transcriptional regulator, general stress-responsive regulator
MASIRQQIETRLQVLQPSVLTIIDDSASHAGHAGAAAHAARTGGNEAAREGTHFEITVVAAAFAGKPPVARHRMIYELLDELMKTRIHALKIDARAPQ